MVLFKKKLRIKRARENGKQSASLVIYVVIAKGEEMNPRDEDKLTTRKELADFTKLSHAIARKASARRVRKYLNAELGIETENLSEFFTGEQSCKKQDK